MLIGKVIGNVVSVRKEDNLRGLKLLVVEFLDAELDLTNKTAVCTDTVSAGPGDLVLTCSSSSARLTKNGRAVCCGTHRPDGGPRPGRGTRGRGCGRAAGRPGRRGPARWLWRRRALAPGAGSGRPAHGPQWRHRHRRRQLRQRVPRLLDTVREDSVRHPG